MVRLWSEEVGDARSVIEPLIRQIDSDVETEVNGPEGFGKETVEVRLRKAGREALCVVTFEAWANAKTDPANMEAALREIVQDIDAGEPIPAYLLTSRGLARQDADRDIEILRDIAAGTEADVLAEQFPKRLNH